MANMNLNVNMDNLTEEERNQLLALIEKSTKKKSKVWKPELEETYYRIEGTKVISNIWHNIPYDNYSYSIGNCFQTEEEAEFAVERLKVIAELKRFAQEHNEKEIDWNNFNQDKFSITYNSYDKKIDYVLSNGCKINFISFTSKKVLFDAIDAIGEDRIKKYYLEVED